MPGFAGFEPEITPLWASEKQKLVAMGQDRGYLCNRHCNEAIVFIMKTQPNQYTVNAAGLSKAQLDLIQQFEADYNVVDRFLRKELNEQLHCSFSALVTRYQRQHRGWKDGDLLKMVADVRNSIVHGKTEPYRYVAMPTPALADALATCRERLTKPALAIPTFQRKVETVTATDSLGDVLRLVHQRDYSQFPIYDEGRFLGLLTETGITRWLSKHIAAQMALIDLDEILVRKVLSSEANQQTWCFFARNERVDDVVGKFSNVPLLEAALFTASGNPSERLIGIATRWDILKFV